MKLFKITMLSLMAGMMSVSCSDFLDKEPLSKGTEAIMFQTPAQFRQAALALYALPNWKTRNYDYDTDISGLSANGGGSAQEDDKAWDFGGLRNCNILLKKSVAYSGNRKDIDESVGTAYFFRAWHHFELLKRFGGVPVIDHVVDVNDEVLFAPRNSRYEVVHFIISDLRKAVELLPMRRNLQGLDKRGYLTKEAAQSFLARVALYEGTWEKYTPAIGLDLDGDGEGIGAGKRKPEGYPSVEGLLQIARDAARDVINEAETGTFALWNECDELSYYYLFNLDDSEGGISNFKGVGKSTNREFILLTPYDYSLERSKVNNCHLVSCNQGAAISAYLGESFLCTNGLPIYYSETGNLADAHYNPEFGGYDTYQGEYENRDWRFQSSTYLPDHACFCGDNEHWVPRTSAGDKYPEVVFPEAKDHFDGSDPAHTARCVIYNPYIDVNSTHNHYGSRKYMPEFAGRNDNNDAADFPVIRLAEVHCIYAEAVCELGNGSISDSDLDFSINKNRARGRVAPLTNALIANIYDANWFNFQTGRHELHKLTMLDEVRRERMTELYGEGFRLDDLKRWGIAHINLTGEKLGRRILGTYYGNPDNKVNSSQYSGTPVYDPDNRPTRYGLVNVAETDLDYGRPIATLGANCLFSQRDYLSPLPLKQLRLNENLKQNPGW